MIYTAISGGGNLVDGGTLETVDVLGGTPTYTYLWTQVDGPEVVIADPTDPDTTFAPEESGIYEFQLKVIDADGLTTASTVEIEIASDTIVLDFTAEGVGEVGDGTLTATTPVNGTAEYTYLWVQTSGPAVDIIGADTANATFEPWEAGTYEFTVTVIDADGNEGSYAVTIVIPCCDVIADALGQLSAGTLSVDADGNLTTI